MYALAYIVSIIIYTLFRPARTKNGPPPLRVTARRQVQRDPRCAAKKLAAQSETLDQRAVPIDIDVLQVTQQAAALTNQQKQPTT
jgi:hypothetical protein